MAYLKLKKESNIGKPINIQLVTDPNEIVGKSNSFGGFEYKVPCVNIGPDYISAGPGSYTINSGQSFELDASDALMLKLRDYQKGELVYIEMAPSDKGEGRVYWKIQPSEETWDKSVKDVKTVSEKPYGYGSVKERDIDRRLDILWGMTFNNATRIACTDKELTPEGKVAIVEQIMPKMFEIAKGLDSQIEEQPPKKDDDDLPF